MRPAAIPLCLLAVACTPSGGGGTKASDACAGYLACVMQVAPSMATGATAAYGPNGACWRTEKPDTCTRACAEGLAALHLANPSTPACAECRSDADCSGSRPACATQSGSCVACTSAAQCQAPTPACDPSTHTCVACASDGDCSGATPACDPTTRTCVECTSGAQCASGSCRKDHSCCVAQSPCHTGLCGSWNDGCGGVVTCPDCPQGQYCDSVPECGDSGTNTCMPIQTTYDCTLCDGGAQTCQKNVSYCYLDPGNDLKECMYAPACKGQLTCACLLAQGIIDSVGYKCVDGMGPNGVGAVFVETK